MQFKGKKKHSKAACDKVELTVQQRGSRTTMGSPGPHGRPNSNARITAPQPVDNEVQHQLQLEREQYYRMMIEKQRQYVDELRSQIAVCPEEKKLEELARTERSLLTLEKMVQSQRSPTAAAGPPNLSRRPISPNGNTGSGSPPPPPLPRRNSAQGQHSGRRNASNANRGELVDNSLYSSSPTPPPLPPRAPLHDHDRPNSINKQMSYPLVATCTPLLNHYSPSHQRTKSSPDSLLGLSPAEASKRLIACESMNDLSHGEGWETPPPPPGTPPPPYPCPAYNETDSPDCTMEEAQMEEPSAMSTIHAATPQSAQQPIISMEDDDMSDQEASLIEDQGPFKSISRLLENPPHLAVFTNYVLSNADPECLLFYLLTDLYKEGGAKEMRKWAFEIHSCFLVPGAPLRLPNVDENIAHEVDDVLTREHDKEEILRKVFWKARSRAKEELTRQLADFKNKRTAGLGTMFGPGDAQLQEMYMDKNKEQRLYDSLFLEKLEPLGEELEKENYEPRRYYTSVAILTVCTRVFNVRPSPGSGYSPDRWPTFVNKDKSFRTRIIGRYSRKLTVKGHHFVAQQYFTVTSCNNCQQIIYGIGPQGYQCSDCHIDLHRPCVHLYEDACPGPVKQKGALGKLIRINEHRRKQSAYFLNMEKERRQAEEKDSSFESTGDTTKPGQPVARSGSDRRPDAVREHSSKSQDGSGHEQTPDKSDNSPVTDNTISLPAQGHHNKKRSSTNINRSESVKEGGEKRKQRRNISDPSHNTTRLFLHSGNAEADHSGHSNPLSGSSNLSHTESGSSSNSSISCNGRLSESPANSTEALGATVNSESDIDVDSEPLNWQELVSAEQLKNLQPHEKKRQDVINELFETERSHVRSLKVLYKIFFKSLQENPSLKPEELHLLFPNIKEVLDIHTHFSLTMRRRRKADPLVREVGDMLVTMFDERLRKAAATFCERQQLALDFIKEKRKRDAKLDSTLMELEKKRQCRRLPLQAILPVEMQRLSKYPLLVERLISSVEQSGDDSEAAAEEVAKLRRAHQLSKDILNHVNEAAKLALNHARLEDIQRHLDTSNFDRLAQENNVANEFRPVDLARYHLILEGPMHLKRANKGPVPVHVLLLEEAVVLLQREGERFLLKFFQSGATTHHQPLSPIIKTSTLLVRNNAAHKSALFLVNTSTINSQMYDLVAEDDQKRDQWFKHFTDATDAYHKREGKSKRPEPPPDKTTPEENNRQGQDSETESVQEIAEPENAVAECKSSSVENVNSQTDDSSAPSPEVEGDGETASNTSTKVGPDDWPLIQPSQVQVAQAPVHTAELRLTQLEQIKRKDEQVRQALADKEELVADLLNIPREHFRHIAEMAGEDKAGQDSDLTELTMAAMHQVDQLQLMINGAYNVSEAGAVAAGGGQPVCASQEPTKQPAPPSVPTKDLMPIVSTLSQQLAALLSAAKHREEERERYRKEVQRLRERLHQDNELHPSLTSQSSPDDQDGTPEPTVDLDAESTKPPV